MHTIGVIALTYDRPQWLAEALASVASQTRLPTEVLVVDDCSPTPPAIDRELVERLPLRVIRQPVNGGPALAAARGLRECRADLIAFLNDDDAWEPGFLESLAAALECYPAAATAFCDHWLMRPDGSIDAEESYAMSRRFARSRMSSGPVPDLARSALVDRSMPGASFSMTRREELDADMIATGGDTWDYFVCLSACRGGRMGVYVDERLGRYRLSPSGVTASYRRDPQRHVASLSRRIVAARLILRSEHLRGVAFAARRGLVTCAVRGVLRAASTGSPSGLACGLREIGRALTEPLD